MILRSSSSSESPTPLDSSGRGASANADYLQNQNIIMEELRAGMNFTIVQKLNARETEDRDHFGKMRATIEAERNS